MIRLPLLLSRRAAVHDIFHSTKIRCISSSISHEKPKDARQIPVTTYAKDKSNGAQTSIPVKDGLVGAVSISKNNESRQAVAFDKGVMPKLTPTMKMFTLEGKVALVTG